MKNDVHEPSVSALLIGGYASDRLLVQEVFRKSGWRLFEARGRHWATRLLEKSQVQVVIAESDLPGWDWKAILLDLRSLVHPPELVVTSRMADDLLWAEVLNLGGYDVLPQPLERDEVQRVVASARRHFDLQSLRETRRPALAAGAA
ncbi:MAG TPA: hypothetical protein VG675_03275 [Bryobacteraceae bacterium]|nr:hypothetical protein [Bryobacteraceae bacterium]